MIARDFTGPKAPKNGLYGVGDVDEMVGDAKARCEMLTERPYAVTLRRMMARGNVRDTGLAREMYRLFRYFARNKRIDAETHRVFEIILRGAGAPRDAVQRFRFVTNDLRRTLETFRDAPGEFTECNRAGKSFLLALAPDPH